MNRRKRTVTVLLCAAVLLAAAAAAVPLGLQAFRRARAEAPPTFELPKEHRTVEFGSYPQSAVTDEETLAALDALELNWVSYGYYSGNVFFGSATQGDFMKYADAELGGERYRAVLATDYRPYCCHIPNEYTRLDTRLELNKKYWFRYEPIRWIVLDEETGLMMSEKLLDCGAFNSIVYVDDPKGKVSLGEDMYAAEYYQDAAHTVYATDYPHSEVRAWLNGTFLETAFSAEEQNRLQLTELDNRACSPKWAKYDAESCEDRVFLLSYFDVTNPDYGFSPQTEKPDPLRVTYPTDYALAQGCWSQEDPVSPGACWWWLRTGTQFSNMNSDVSFYGIPNVYTYVLPYFPDFTDSGYRPAIRLTDIP